MTSARPVLIAAAVIFALATRSDAQSRGDAGGNPVAQIPLSSLSATRERPLFSPTRRPPPAPVIAAEPPPAITKASAVIEAPEGPPFTLMGTLLGPADRIAIFINEKTRQSTRIHEGAADSGWKLVTVDQRSAVLQGSGQVVKLALPEKSANAPISIADKGPAPLGFAPPPEDAAPDDESVSPTLRAFRRRAAQK